MVPTAHEGIDGERPGPEYTGKAGEAVEDVQKYCKAFEDGRDCLCIYVVCERES